MGERHPISPDSEGGILIRDGMVFDGTGNPWKRCDVVLRGDRIEDMDGRIESRCDVVIEASGLCVAPGFVDLHSHAASGDLIFARPTADNVVLQGVTTVISGPDGGSPHPLSEFFARLADVPISINLGMFVGHNTIRREVVGLEAVTPNEAQISEMKRLVREAMRAGAFGLSSGLKYLPGMFSKTGEVVELARAAAEFGGIYISHMRDEGLKLIESVRETIEIGEKANIPAQITHHKVVGTDMWGRSEDTLAMVNDARRRGVDVTIDQYPYTASQAGLTILFPPWSLEGGFKALRRRLRDGKQRSRIKDAVIENLVHDRGGNDPARVLVVRCTANRDYEGQTLAEILEKRGTSVNFESAAELVLELLERGEANASYFCLSEEDVERIMAHPASMIASDGVIDVEGVVSPHPRSYGAFPRVLGTYVREKGVLSMEEAIRKMTSFPARRVGLCDRGMIRPGMKADVVVFDPETVAGAATFQNPRRHPVGIEYVIVNGEIVVHRGRHTGATPGEVLRGRGRRAGASCESSDEGSRKVT